MRINRAKDLYTVEEFEQLVEEYCRSVDRSACEDALHSASAAQSEAESRLQDLVEKKDTAVESAIKAASSVLAARESDAEAAAGTLIAARGILADAEKVSAEAQAAKLSADQALQAALEALNKAAGESRTADTGVSAAKKARDDAGQSVTDAESALKDAKAAEVSAASVLEEKRAALTDAENALHDAAAAHALADKKLADLTSDNTFAALREQKQLADTALQSALAKQGIADEALKQAKAALAQAEKAVSGAKTFLQEADTRLAEASGRKDSAKKAVDQVNAEVEDLREQYASVLRAIAARDAAKENLDRAKAALKDAESDLGKAGTELERAQNAREITADRLIRAAGLSVEAALLEDIEDPDFIYLNEYVSAMKAADAKLSSARESLDDANTELASRKTDSENAQKVYTAALADFEIARNRAEMSAVNPDPVPERILSVETAATADHREAAAPDGIGKDSGERVRKVTRNRSGSASVEAAPVATGDTSNVMGWLAGLLAGAGLMLTGARRRKGEKMRSGSKAEYTIPDRKGV